MRLTATPRHCRGATDSRLDTFLQIKSQPPFLCHRLLFLPPPEYYLCRKAGNKLRVPGSSSSLHVEQPAGSPILIRPIDLFLQSGRRSVVLQSIESLDGVETWRGIADRSSNKTTVQRFPYLSSNFPLSTFPGPSAHFFSCSHAFFRGNHATLFPTQVAFLSSKRHRYLPRDPSVSSSPLRFSLVYLI